MLTFLVIITVEVLWHLVGGGQAPPQGTAPPQRTMRPQTPAVLRPRTPREMERGEAAPSMN